MGFCFLDPFSELVNIQLAMMLPFGALYPVCSRLTLLAPPVSARDSHGRARVVSRWGLLFFIYLKKGLLRCQRSNRYVPISLQQVETNERSGINTMLNVLSIRSTTNKSEVKTTTAVECALFSGAIC